jgi:hypothetical protein
MKLQETFDAKETYDIGKRLRSRKYKVKISKNIKLFNAETGSVNMVINLQVP